MSTEIPSDPYGVDQWGKDYARVSPDGDLALLNPLDPAAPPISLPSIVKNIEARGIQSPVLLRVASYLKHSIDHLNQCFADAIAASQYRGTYRGVFPIKVNQQAHVVDLISQYGRQHHFGFEAGSKPELVIALSQLLTREALIICNGVKDKEFIELAIRSRQIGFNTVIVLESLKEIELVIAVAQELDLDPMLGVRIKLNHRVSGNWAESSGDRSTFGLTINQIVDLVDQLRKANLLHCLVLQHSHLGSQIPNVNDVRRAVSEACRVFTELSKEGVPLAYLDLGGGLGVDYTGQKSSTVNSTNYTTEEYCSNIVEVVGYAMEEAGLDHPTIITESGRAISAHSSVLIFSVLEATRYDDAKMQLPEDGDHHFISDLAAITDYLTAERMQECLNDARYYRDELRRLFSMGNIGIREMARAEKIFLHISSRIKALIGMDHPHSSEMEEKLNQLVDIYHCNFSLFQSLPDVWGIDQLHPIVPLQRLNEAPSRRAILSDITCDSDGKIDHFISHDGEAASLPVHDLTDDEPYYLGVFFVGAYQETLGDLHNLFGDTNVVTVDFDGNGGVKILHETEGDSISDVLSYVEYDPRDCVDAFKKIVEQAVSDGKIGVKERKSLIAAYKGLMSGYTYFENSEPL
ncbi:MAG: biosynthetic arginine decarboxylase [Pseudomonadota bacterium]